MQISAFVRALRDEARIQRQQGGTKIEIADGHLLNSDVDGGTYRFDLHSEVFLPSDVPVILEVGRQQYDAEVLHREGDWLYLYVSWSARSGRPPQEIPNAVIKAAPWFLHEELANRLESISDFRTAKLLLAASRGIAVGDASTGIGVVGAAGSSLTLNEIPSIHPHRVPSTVQVKASGYLSSRGMSKLNQYQIAAIKRCMHFPLSFVWGPPGTGKTSTLGHLVAQLALEKESILVAAHANVAVDAATLAICTALEEVGLNHSVVRVGLPVEPRVRELGVSSHDRALAQRRDLAERLRSLEKQIVSLGSRHGSSLSDRIAREFKEVRAELRQEERRIIATASLLLATLPKCAITEEVYGREFDTVIVDEASMAYPPQVVFAGTLARKRLSIFGDFRQLSPIVLSENQQTKENLGRDIFDFTGIVHKVDSAKRPANLSMLRIQYRMHPRIRELVSRFAYHDQLEDAPDVGRQTQFLAQNPPCAGEAIVVLDTAALGAAGWRDHEDRSRWNPIAAVWSFRIAYELALSGTSSRANVALLTPYRAQARFLSALVRGFQVRDKITVGTVHRFQGAERAAVVLDLTDAPPLPLPGLLLQGAQGRRLMTVGTSRAKGKLVVLADRRLLQRSAPPGDMLRRYKLTESLETPTSLSTGESSLEWVSKLADVEAELQSIINTQPVWCWLSSDVPRSLQQILGKSPEKRRNAPDGQALIIAGESVWICGRQRQWFAICIRNAYVARAVWQLLEGARIPTELRNRRQEEKGEPAPTLSLPRCMCGTPMVLEKVRQDWSGPVIKRVCGSCGKSQFASTDDLTRWAYLMKIFCPLCSSAVIGRQGDRGLFYGCSKFPECKGRIDLKNVF